MDETRGIEGAGLPVVADGHAGRKRRTRRLRIVPPPPPVPGWVEEIYVLREVGELGLPFWRMLRRVHLWARMPPEDRQAGLQLTDRAAFERLGNACAHAPELVEAFGTFAALARAPHRIDADRIADACRLVYEWADGRSLMGTALLFAEAAAVADPADPARANDAGRTCRRAARDDRAADWYLRGFGLAVRTGSRDESLRALLGYGNLMKDLGRHDEAKKFFWKAAQRATGYGRLRQAAEAHHDLLTIAAEVGVYSDGERHVRKALDLYPLQHPQLPALAHDWAFLLLRLDYYTPAISVLELALPKIARPEIQTVVWGNLARAYGGARRLRQFEDASLRVRSLVGRYGEFAPSALNGLAHGSWGVGDLERAKQYAESALQLARARKDGGEERIAQALLDRLLANDTAPHEQEPGDRNHLTRIFRQFQARLAKWKRASPDAGTGTASVLGSVP